MRITHDGKVGIGVTTPGYSLDISGDIMIRGDDIRDSGGNVAISFDGSGNIDNNIAFSGIPSFDRSGPGSNPASLKVAKGIGSTGNNTTLIDFSGDSGRNIEIFPAGSSFMKFTNPSSGQNEIYINNGGQDTDLRMDTDTETHTLFIDGEAGSGRVGFGFGGSGALNTDARISV